MDKAAIGLVEWFGGLDDPRALDGRHRLGDILVIAFCTVLCGQEEFTAMARFGLEKESWLRGFLELPGGIPSHDTFRAVLSALDARQLAQVLIGWTEGVRAELGGESVAIDGKSARRSGSSARAARCTWSTPGRWTTGCAWVSSRRAKKATRSPPCRCCGANSNWRAAS